MSLSQEDKSLDSWTLFHCPIMKFTPTSREGAGTLERNTGERMKGAIVIGSVKIKFEKGHKGGETELIL